MVNRDELGGSETKAFENEEVREAWDRAKEMAKDTNLKERISNT